MTGTKDRPLMTGAQLRHALDRLDLSHVRASELTGYDPRTLRRFLTDEYPVPRVLAALLRVMVKCNIKPEEIT